MASPQKSLGFLDLSAELRNLIYEMAADSICPSPKCDQPTIILNPGNCQYPHYRGFAQTCRQIRKKFFPYYISRISVCIDVLLAERYLKTLSALCDSNSTPLSGYVHISLQKIWASKSQWNATDLVAFLLSHPGLQFEFQPWMTSEYGHSFGDISFSFFAYFFGRALRKNRDVWRKVMHDDLQEITIDPKPSDGKYLRLIMKRETSRKWARDLDFSFQGCELSSTAKEYLLDLGIDASDTWALHATLLIATED